MFYLITEYTIPVVGSKSGRKLITSGRKLITIGNKNSFADMYDFHPFIIGDKERVIDKETLAEFVKDGFPTQKEAMNDKKVKKAINDFVGFGFEGKFLVVSEEELLKKYNTLKGDIYADNKE